MNLVFLMCFVLVLVGSYLVCGIPFGMLIAKWFSDVDVRLKGSGNIGSTNVCRTAGIGAGALTLVLDGVKGFLSMWLSRVILSNACAIPYAEFDAQGSYFWAMAVLYMTCVLGHVFSIYLKGKGGKGIAVGFGATFAFIPWVAAGLMAVFLAAAIPSRYVSLGSICAAVSLPFWVMIFYAPSFTALIPFFVVSAVVVWAHRSNLAKLQAHTESTFSFKDKPSDN